MVGTYGNYVASKNLTNYLLPRGTSGGARNEVPFDGTPRTLPAFCFQQYMHVCVTGWKGGWGGRIQVTVDRSLTEAFVRRQGKRGGGESRRRYQNFLHASSILYIRNEVASQVAGLFNIKFAPAQRKIRRRSEQFRRFVENPF